MTNVVFIACLLPLADGAFAAPTPASGGWQNLGRAADPNKYSSDGGWTAAAPDLVGVDPTRPYLQYQIDSGSIYLKIRVEAGETGLTAPAVNTLMDLNGDGVPEFTMTMSVKEGTGPNAFDGAADVTGGVVQANTYDFKLLFSPLSDDGGADANISPSTTTIEGGTTEQFSIYDSVGDDYSVGSAGPSLTDTAGNLHEGGVAIYFDARDLDSDGNIEHDYIFSFKLTAYDAFVAYMNNHLEPSSGSVNYETLVGAWPGGTFYGAAVSATQDNSVNGDIGGGAWTGSETWREIFGINDVPVAKANTYGTLEDVTLSGKNIVTDTDAVAGTDSDTETATASLVVASVIVSSVETAFASLADGSGAFAGWKQVTLSHGTAYLQADGSFQYVPAANDAGGDSFSYKVSDGDAESNAALVTLNVTAVDDPPTAVADANTAREAGGAGNGTAGVDPEGNVVTGVVTLTAGSDVNGAADADAESGVTVTSVVNLAKTSMATSVTGSHNDLDSAYASASGLYGELRILDGGGYRYVVDNANADVEALRLSGDTLVDTFTYTITDGGGNTDDSTLTITIQGANDNPGARNDYNTAKESLTASLPMGGVNYDANDPLGMTAVGNVLTNDDDIDENGETAAIVGFTATATADVIVNNGGTTELSFSAASTLNNVSAGYYIFVNQSGTFYAVVDSGSNPVTVASNIQNADGTYSIVLSATPDASTDIGNASEVAFNNSYVASFTNTSGKKLATVSTSEPVGSSTVTITPTSGAIAAGMSVSGDGVPAGTSVTSVVYTSDVASQVELNNELTSMAGAVLTFAAPFGQTLTGQYGSLSLAGDGGYTYTPTADSAVLSEGDSGVETFTYTMQDALNVTSTANLVILVYGSGANDPNAKADAVDAVEAGGVANGTAGVNPTGNLLTGTGASGAVADTTPTGSLVLIAARAAGDATDTSIHAATTGDTTSGSPSVTVASGTGINVGMNVTGSGIPGGTTVSGVSGTTVTLSQNASATASAVNLLFVEPSSVDLTLTGLYGSLILHSDGSYGYTIDNAKPVVQALRTATDTLSEVFTYRVANGAFGSGNLLIDSTTLTMTLKGANDAPVAVNDTATGVETGVNAGMDASGDVLPNDTDVDDAVHTVTAVRTGSTEGAGTAGTVGVSLVGTYGSLTLNADGGFNYVVDESNATVNALASGGTLVDSFNYTVQDDTTPGGELTDTAVLAITIIGDNDAPVAKNNTYAATEDTLLANLNIITDNDASAGTDSDAEGSGLTLVSVNGASFGVLAASSDATGHPSGDGWKQVVLANGTLYLKSNGAIEYMPVSDSVAGDSFVYAVSDGSATSNEATVSITVGAQNDPPVARANTYVTDEDIALTDANLNIISNNDFDAGLDSDPDHALSALTVGSVTVNSVETAFAGLADGVDSFAGWKVFTLAHGVAYLKADGSIQYHPVANDHAGDSFSYKVTDGSASSGNALVTFVVNAVNDAPVAQADTGAVNENATLTVTAANGVITSTGVPGGVDSDIDGDTLTVIGVKTGTAADAASVGTGNVGGSLTGTYGRLTLAANGGYAYVADTAAAEALAQGATVTDVFSYAISDGNGGEAFTTLTITITGQNDAPAAQADTGAVNENATLTVTAANGVITSTGVPGGVDSDVDGDTLTVIGVKTGTAADAASVGTSNVGSSLTGTYGHLTLAANGGYSYVADTAAADALNLGDDGVDVFSYAISDGKGGKAFTTLTITVSGLDDDLSVNDVVVNEASPYAVFTVTGGSGQQMKLGLTDGTATVDADGFPVLDGSEDFGPTLQYYDPTANMGSGGWVDYVADTYVAIPAGETTLLVRTPIINDGLFEGAHAFSLVATNTSATAFTGAGTIKDDGTGAIYKEDGTTDPDAAKDDDRPSFSVNDVTVNEAAGTLIFTVTKTGQTALASSVDYATADNTALAGSDYTALTTTTLNFTAGDATKSVSVTILNDTPAIYEGSENFHLNLAAASGATISDAQGEGTILDDGTGAGGLDDDRPAFSVNDVTVNEAAGTLIFTVTKTGQTALASSVDYATADNTALAGSDYTALTTTTLNFTAGDATKSVSVTILNDTPAIYEGSENFHLNLAAASGATISDAQGEGTILDDGTGAGGLDDDRPSFSVNDVTVNEAAGTLIFTVTKTGQTALASSVDYATADNTALAGSDYTALTTTTLNFTAGDATKSVSVTILNDTPAIYEGSENFHLNLAAASGATISDAQGEGTILDDGTGAGGLDDDRPSFSVNDVTVNEAAGTLIFTVTKTGQTALASSVDYATADNTALAGSDYTALTTTTLNFTAGDATKSVSVTILNDTPAIYEGSENFHLNLAAASGATISDAQGVGTILDDGTGAGGLDDDRPAFSVNDVTVNEAAGTLIFTVTKTGQTALASSVDYATADNTALAGSDYTALTTTTLNFTAGDATKSVSVTILNDTPAIYEGSENFHLNLAAASGATISDAQGEGTILDDGTGAGGLDDDRPAFSVNDVTVNEAAGTLIFTVTKTGQTALASSVDYATADNTALAGSDYTALTTTTLNFTAGDATKSVSVTILNDTPAIYEGSENFHLNLAAASGATISDAQGEGTILDDGTGAGGLDDDRPAFSVNDVTVNEAAGTLIFTVTKTGQTALASSVDYATADNTALAGSDYTALTTTTLNFTAGDATKSVSVTILNDTPAIYEGSENFHLNLAAASGATISDAQGEGTILDDGTGAGGLDDDRPAFSVNDVTVNEAAGTLIFTVTKTGQTALASSVDYATADNTALAGSDYTALTTTTLNFTAGDATKSVSVTILNDTPAIYEGSENFHLNLAAASGATISDAQGEGTILDDGTGAGGLDDDRPAFSVNDVTVNEAAGTLIFTVTKTGQTALASSVDYATADNTALAGSDYTALTTTTLNFTAGDATKSVSVTILNDTPAIYEGSENFHLNLAAASGATISDAQGEGTILDDGTGAGGLDDDRPAFSVNDVTVNEAAGTLIFTVTKTGQTALASSVDYATADNTALAGSDYTALTTTTLNFTAGDATKSVSVTILNDTPAIYEGSENFHLNLAAASGATISDAQGEGTILDDGTGAGGLDDDRPAFSVNDVTVNEAAGTLIFTVTKTGQTALASSVDYATADNTALAGSDYTALTTTTLNFTAGDATKSVSVTILNDTPAIYEGSENFHLNLAAASGATISDAQGEGTILDDGTGAGGLDDDRPAFSVNDVTVNEAAGTLIFTVTKTGQTALASSVDYATADNTALAGSDYTALTTTTLNFTAGDATKSVSVTILNDTPAIYEGSENFHLNLAAASGATISDAQGEGTILDDGTGAGGLDDDRPAFSVNDVTVNEAAGTLIFTVTKTGQTALASSVDYATADNTALAGSDYTALTTTTLNFTAGDATKSVSVTILNDTPAIYEGSENFHLNLAAASGATISDAQGEGTILDDGTGAGGLDDDRPSFSVNDVTVNEAAGTLIFTVTKTGQTALASSVDYATADNTALAGSDYTALTTTTLNFTAGDATKSVSVTILNDTPAIYEGSENFHLNLAAASGATISDAQGEGTILDDGTGAGGLDDDRPAFSVNDVTVNEAAGTLIFTVTKTGQTALASSVDYATADNTALAGSDYTALTTTTLNFTAGDATKSVSVTILNDTPAIYEGSENFHLNLAAASGATISDAQGEGTILDDGTGAGGLDDDRPLSVNDVTANEASPHAVFAVSGAAGQLASLTTTEGTATAADFGPGLQYFDGAVWQDYTPGSNVALDGTGALLVRTPIVADEENEGPHSFTLSATNTGGTSGTGTGTITDDGTGDIFKEDGTTDPDVTKDDDRPLSVNDVTVNEASPHAVFTITGAAGQLASLTTTEGTATAADFGPGLQYFDGAVWQDYTPGSNVALDGTGALLVRTPIVADEENEGPHTFMLSATNTGGTSGTGTGTITDDGTGDVFKEDGTTDPDVTKDDDRPLSVNDVTVNEASPHAVFTITGAAGQLASLTTTEGTATEADFGPGLQYFDGAVWRDYTPGSNVALDGAGSLPVRTPIVNDAFPDGPETFTLSAVNLSGSVFNGAGTIVDDGSGDVFGDNGQPDVTAAKDTDLPDMEVSFTTPEDTPYSGQLVYEPDGNQLSYTLTTGPEHGVALVDPDGSYSYLPNEDYHGPDEFTVVVADGRGGSALITVRITVTPVNDPPNADPDMASVDEGSENNVIQVLGNDSDPDGDDLTVVSAMSVNASVSVNPDGSLKYTPHPDFYGVDVFTYLIRDPDSLTDTATVTVVVYAKPINALPEVEFDGAGEPIPQKVFQNTSLIFSATNTPPNGISVSDPDSEALTVTIGVTNGVLMASRTLGLEFAGGVSMGTNTLVMSGLKADLNAALEGLAYTPAPDYFGPDFLSILTVDEGGRFDADNAGVAILVEIQALGGIPNVDLSATAMRPGLTVTNVALTRVDNPELIQSVELNSTNLTVEVLPMAGQDGSTNRTTVYLTITYDDGSSILTPVPVIIYQPLLTSSADGFYNATYSAPLFNPQTSLYEQRVRVVNGTPFDFTALRITSTNLPATVTLRNATGTNALGPYVEYNLPVPVNSEQELNLEYFSQDRKAFTPGLKLELLNQARTIETPASSRQISVQGFRGYNPVTGRTKFYVEFPTEAGLTYVVQYRDTMTPGPGSEWKTSPVSIPGTGQRLHWLDEGAPNTDSPPGATRFYRVLVVEQP